jgi:hypothetical protein
MPGVDRSAPLRFLRTAYQPDDWVAVFLKSYETGRVVQRVGPLSMVVTPRYQAWASRPFPVCRVRRSTRSLPTDASWPVRHSPKNCPKSFLTDGQ